MMSIGSNVASTSGVGSSGGPLTYAWLSLTMEEQLENFKRIIRKQHSSKYFDGAFYKCIARVVKELRIDPWVDIETLLVRQPMELLRGTTPLHWATLMDDRTMVHYILTSGRVDINASTKALEETALHYAIIGGNYNIVEDLLKHKANVCILNISGESALYYMVLQKYSMFDILKTILVDNVNLCDEAKNTSLHYATKEGATNVVTYLINEKADVNLHNQFGYTPLHYATEKGSLDVVTCLLQHNAKVNVLNDDGWSPLHLAIKQGSMNIVSLLVEKNANVDALTKDGLCALHIAIVEGYVDIAIYLIKHNANVDALTKDGLSPLHFASARGYLDIVTCLMEHNANVNALDKDGWSPLLFSISNGRVDTSKKLIIVGADVHVKDKWNNNVLHIVTWVYNSNYNMMNIVQLLQEHNIDANAKNAEGYSPFFVAVAGGHTELVKELLRSKEKIKLMEECNGQSAIQIAFDKGHEHIKRALLECDDVSRYVGALYRDRQVYVDAANAILVGATLIASVTFASWLQPPLGYTTSYLDLGPSSSDINYVDVEDNVPLRAFWVFNTLSFYFAIGTVVFGARSVLPRRQKFIKDIVVQLHKNLLVTSILLACSVFFVIIAFGIAGCIVLTPTLKFQWYMIVPTIFGGLVCLVSLGFLFKSMVEDNLGKNTEIMSLYYFDNWNLMDFRRIQI